MKKSSNDKFISEANNDLDINYASIIIESITEAIIVINYEGSIYLINESAENLLGYKKSEIIGQKIEKFLPELFQHKHINHRKEYIVNPKVRQMGIGMDLFAVHKDGSEFPCEVSLSTLNINNEKHIICCLHDLSLRKRAENMVLERNVRLNEQYKELESIYATSPVGMCYMDNKLRFLKCNEKLAEINGISAADHIGKTLRDVIPEIAETMEPVYRKVIDTGEPVIDVEASMFLSRSRIDRDTR